MLIESEELKEWLTNKYKHCEKGYYSHKADLMKTIYTSQAGAYNEVLEYIKQLEDNNVNSRDNTK